MARDDARLQRLEPRRMIGRRLARLLCLLTALSGCADRPANTGGDGASWRGADVVVTERPGAEERRLLLWVRLVNQSTAIRGVCARSISWAVSHDDYQNVGTSGDARPCGDAAAFDLVAPGESSYVSIPIAREDLDLPEAELVVKLVLADAPVPQLHPVADVPLEWRLAVGGITLRP
jgi:hypothetical protein